MVRNFSPRQVHKQLFEANRLINTWSVYVLIQDEPLKISCKRSDLGRQLLDGICQELNIVDEIDCFGLKYIDASEQRYWIDTNKPLSKQLKYASNFVLSFEFQFYPAQLELITSENARTLLFRQLCNDINQGHLKIKDTSDRSEVAAFAIHAHFGLSQALVNNEFNCVYDKAKLILALKEIFPKESYWMFDSVETSLLSINDLSKYDAETRFIELVQAYDTYGLHTVNAKDKNGHMVNLGVNYRGIHVITIPEDLNIRETYDWASIQKITVDNTEINIYFKKIALKKKIFKLASYRIAKETWKYILRQQGFFTFDKGEFVPRQISSSNIFKKRSKFYYSGRSQRELVIYASTRNTPMNLSRQSTLRIPCNDKNVVYRNQIQSSVIEEIDEGYNKADVQPSDVNQYQESLNPFYAEKEDQNRYCSDIGYFSNECKDVICNDTAVIFSNNKLTDEIVNSTEISAIKYMIPEVAETAMLYPTTAIATINQYSQANSLLQQSNLYQTEMQNDQNSFRAIFIFLTTLTIIWLLINSNFDWKGELNRLF